MNAELNAKLNTILKSIQESLNDIKKNGRKARELKASIKKSRDIVTEVIEQQLGGVSLEDQINISKIPDEDWLITINHIIDEINYPFVSENEYETYFIKLFRYLITTDMDTLVSNMFYSYNKLMNEGFELFDMLTEKLDELSLFIESDPESGKTGLFEQRASVLKQHSYDFLWLYKHLEDYTSKRTLAAILMNWADLQFPALSAVRSIFKKYWEPDLFRDNKGDILVSIGVGNGTSLKEYVDVYGSRYEKIYAYEPSPHIFTELSANVNEWGLHDMEVFNKGVGNIRKRIVVDESPEDDIHLIRLTGPKEKEKIVVDYVKIDDDVKESVSFITIGAGKDTKQALISAEKTIKKNKPKLAVCIDGELNDLWKVPTMILSINPNYKLYLRHYGNELIPTDFVIICKQ